MSRETFNFSNKKDQDQFEALPKKTKRLLIDESHQEALEMRIPEISSFDELYKIIKDMGSIENEYSLYTNGKRSEAEKGRNIIDASRLTKIIETFRKNPSIIKDKLIDALEGKDKKTLEFLEKSGLREKVLVLLNNEINSNNPNKPSNFPPGFPPEAIFISNNELAMLKLEGGRTYVSHDRNDYPKIGATNLATEYGKISGRLVWCDFRTAVFETPRGYISMKFGKLIAPSGETYEQEEQRRNQYNQQKIMHKEL